jgi:hypothetical protein
MAEHFHADEGIHLNRSLQESIGVILPGLSKTGRQNASQRMNTAAQKQKNPPSEESGLGDQADAASARSLRAGVARRGRDA